MNKEHLRVRWPLIITILILAVLAYGEIMLRCDYAHDYANILLRHAGERRHYRSDPELVYAGMRHVDGINAHGYFDDEHSFTKPEGTFRIVVIGDSIAAGVRVTKYNSFGKLLEKDLTSTHPKKKIEVILLALSGYSTSQELIVLQKQAFRYDPDLIIWSYCLNDPTHPIFHHSREIVLYYKPKVFLWAALAQRFFFFKQRLKAIKYHYDSKSDLADLQRSCIYLHFIYWDEVAANIKKISQITDQHKVPAIFIVHPFFKKIHASFAHYSFRSLHNKLLGEAKKNHLITIDLLEVYKPYTALDLGFPEPDGMDHWHPNVKGHQLIADCLAPIVQKIILEQPAGLPFPK